MTYYILITESSKKWIETMPVKPIFRNFIAESKAEMNYEAELESYESALQLAKDNAIEIEDQKEIMKLLPENAFEEFNSHTATILMLKPGIYSITTDKTFQKVYYTRHPQEISWTPCTEEFYNTTSRTERKVICRLV